MKLSSCSFDYSISNQPNQPFSLLVFIICLQTTCDFLWPQVPRVCCMVSPICSCFPPSNFPLCFFSPSAIILLAVKIYEKGTLTRVGWEYSCLEDMSHKPCELHGRQVERQCHREDAAEKGGRWNAIPGWEAQTNRSPSSCAGVFRARHAGWILV